MDDQQFGSVRSMSFFTGVLLAATLAVGAAFAQTEGSIPTTGALKKMSLEELMDMDVTSVSKKPEAYGQAPAAIQVITGEEIRRSGVFDIPDALRLADNLEVARKGSHAWAISSRGFNTDLANKLLVLMDGRSVYTPLFSGVFWDIQDYLLADIDRIEVISGPGGTLWGANAVNGVINITSKSAKDTQGLYIEGGGGTDLRDLGSVRYGAQLAPDVYFRVYGKFFDRNNEVLPNGTDAADSWSMGRGGFRLDAETSASTTFTLQGGLYSGYENVPTGAAALVSGNDILGRWSRAFSDESSVSVQLYYDRTFLKDPVPPDAPNGVTLAPAGILTDSLDTYDLDFQHHLNPIPGHQLTWGLGYRFTRDMVQDAPALAFDPALLDQNLFSGFAQDEVKILESLFFTIGSKVEHNDYTGFEVEPSARLKWELTADQMFWSAVSRAVRMPSRVDRDERLPTPVLAPFGTYATLIGGSGFLSETVIAYELGYRAQWGPNVSTSVSGFFNNYDDIRSAGLSPPSGLLLLSFPLIFQNNLQGQTGGVEATVDWQVLDGWRLHAGYDYLKENIWVKSGQSDFNKALNETADPPNQVFVRSSMDLPGNLEMDPAFRWVDAFTYNNNGVAAGVADYMELDLRLGWRPTRELEISLSGWNLIHDHHLEYVVSGSAPREEIRRSIEGQIACRF